MPDGRDGWRYVTREPRCVVVWAAREGGLFSGAVLPKSTAELFLATVRATGGVPRSWLEPGADCGPSEMAPIAYVAIGEVPRPTDMTWDTVLQAPRLL